jgi:membrane protein
LKKPGPDFLMQRAFAIALDAYRHFDADDGWAIASHIALSALMAMFPFFIVLTSLAGSFGFSNLADEIAKLMLTVWPEEVALPLAREIQRVLTTAHTGVLTLGLVLAVFFASSGVESLRIGLNRAYDVVETRNWLLLRLESIAFVLLAALGLLALGILVVLGPLLFNTALRYAPSPASSSWSRCSSRTNGCRPAAGASSKSCRASRRRWRCGSQPAWPSAAISPSSRSLT